MIDSKHLSLSRISRTIVIDMPFCTNCGTEYEKGDGFCSSCGNQLSTKESAFNQSTEIPSNRPLSECDGLNLIGQDPEMDYQGVWTRFIAISIDSIILYIILFIILFAMPFIGLYLDRDWIWPFFLVSWLGYFVLLEGFKGQTIGKMITKIKVVKDDGTPCDLQAAFMRNAIRFIDMLPFMYIIGAVSMIYSKKEQRLGDRAAKTVVIKA